jgi:SAM-dependent methyltransferase
VAEPAVAPAVATEQVRALFDSKADGWPGKYAPDGRLAGRLTGLAAAVYRHVAPGGRVLDLGCGTGELARTLAASGFQVTGCDIAPRMLAHAGAADPGTTASWLRLDPAWRTLPLQPGRLDGLVASSVLEYVPDPVTVLAECARVLRPGGVLLCTVPNPAHPVRWLEWAAGRMAAVRPARRAAEAVVRLRPYLAYLQTSRQRRTLRWWHAAGRSAGLTPVPAPAPSAARPTTLRLLVFTREERS